MNGDTLPVNRFPKPEARVGVEPASRPTNRREFLVRSLAVTGSVMACPAARADVPVSADVVDRLSRIPSRHPRLHFGSGEVAALRDPVNARVRAYRDALLEWVDRHRDWRPASSNRDARFANTVLEEEGMFITNAALAWVATGERDRLELARDRALAMCEIPNEEGQWYSLGMYLAGLGRTYDWLYGELSQTDRARIRSHLARHVATMFRGSFAGTKQSHWWAPYPLHHDYWIPVGGFGEAALAILGEEADAARWSARALQLFDEAWDWMGSDGAWHEGVGDWCYAVSPLLTFYGAWGTVVGDNLHDRAWLRNTARYRLYHYLTGSRYVALNDSFGDGRYGPTGAASCHLLRRLASLFRDGHAQWLADEDEQYDVRQLGKVVQRAPHEQLSFRAELREDVHASGYCHAWNLLWYDASVDPVPPTRLPLSAHFENQGIVIARTGWDREAMVASLSCAPLGGQRCAERVRAGESMHQGNVAHAHVQYNACTFARGDSGLVVPPGYARRGSRFQNAVAVNGAALRNDLGVDVHVIGYRSHPEFAYACGDATAGFPEHPRVARYRRHLVLHSTGALFVFDDIELAPGAPGTWSGWNDFQWTVHTDPRRYRVASQGDRLDWHNVDRDANELRMHVLAPDAFAWEHALLESTDGVPMIEAHRIVRPEWYSSRMQVLAVFDRGDGPPPRPLPGPHLVGATLPGAPGVTFAFATTPLSDRQLAEWSSTVESKPLIVFGFDPDRPSAIARVSAAGAIEFEQP